MSPTVSTVVFPAFLANALVNGDIDNLDDHDLHWFEVARAVISPGRVVDVGDSFFSSHCDLPGFRFQAEMAEYAILYDRSTAPVEAPDTNLRITESVVDAYLSAAIFTAGEWHGREMNEIFDVSDFAKLDRTHAHNHLIHFAEAAQQVLRVWGDKALEENRNFVRPDTKTFAKDFWFSRNGHGTGFFAHPERYDNSQELADALQSVAERFGESHVEVRRSRLIFNP